MTGVKRRELRPCRLETSGNLRQILVKEVRRARVQVRLQGSRGCPPYDGKEVLEMNLDWAEHRSRGRHLLKKSDAGRAWMHPEEEEGKEKEVPKTL